MLAERERYSITLATKHVTITTMIKYMPSNVSSKRCLHVGVGWAWGSDLDTAPVLIIMSGNL